VASSPLTYSFQHQPLPIYTPIRSLQYASVEDFTSPDGKFSVKDSYLINNATGEKQLIENSYGTPTTFSADSKSLYYTEQYQRSDSDFSFTATRLIRYEIEDGKIEYAGIVKYSDLLEYYVQVSDNKEYIVFREVLTSDFDYADNTYSYYYVDADTGVSSKLNTSSSGLNGNGVISEAQFVGDGNSVVFVSTSSNLVANDTNGAADIFLKDLTTGTVTLLSKSASGVQVNGTVGGIDVSADGTKILFTSTATNLVSAETIGFKNVYVKDLATGTVTLVSATPSGTAGNGDSDRGAFSPDGRSVAFISSAANLVANDLNGRQDAFLKNLGSGAITSLSLNTEGSVPFSVPVADAKPTFSSNGEVINFGNYNFGGYNNYTFDSAGFLILDVATNVPWYDLDGMSISQGDGTAARVFGTAFAENQPRTATISIDYDRDGDFRATITGLKMGTAVSSQSFTVKVRAHAGSQNFTGDASGELVLLSASADKADGGGGDDVLYGYGGADDLSGGAGNDVLDGGFGNDILRGGTGDDRYYVENAGDSVVEAAGAGRDTVFARYSATLGANVEDLVLLDGVTGTGNALANVITGNAADNTLYGLDGNDVLDGKAGADRMIGGAGDDTYFFDRTGDVAEEQAGGGTDTIVTRFNMTLGTHYENLTLSDDPRVSGYSPPTQGTGNAVDNVVTGNRENNVLNGLDGNDRLIGGDGGDRLFGGNGTDTLEGGANNDALDGGNGADIMIGGAGDDSYVVSEVGDQVIETADGGIDAIRVSFSYTLAANSNIENLYAQAFTSRSYVFVGNELNNRISGSGGDDVLDGRTGADTLDGGRGNDSYYVDNAGDVVRESLDSGMDTVITSVGFVLAADASVETLRFADNRAAGILELTGSSIGQTLIGNGGASRLSGRGGDDTYIVDGNDDLVFEAGAEGNDTVVTSGSYTLGIGQEIETLRLADPAGTAARTLTGNGFSNALIGNAGANTLDGAGGADSLTGGAGNDIYVVDVAGDQVFEKAGEGTDTVRTSVSYVLAAGQSIETLELAAGTASLDLTGNELANTLRDNAGNNRLDGGAGRDTLISLGGRDVLLGGQDSDSAIIDRSGATAALRFVMQSVGGTTTLVGDGTTTTSIGNITLTGGSGADTFTTLDGIDTLNGGAGADTLNGGAGADRLTGGTGNDAFVVDNAGDLVFEASGGGVDRVFASTSYTLQAGQEIEGLQLLAATGSANLNLTGNAISQSLVGNNGANVINGGVGRDAMTGRGGDDTYIVDNLGDRVTEAAGGGRDTVLATASYALGEGQEIEALQLRASTGSARFNLSGNAFGQSLVGNNGANVLDGRGGGDVLTGRGGADSFAFSTALGAGNVDRIVDFAAEDTMRLSKSVFSALAPGQLAESAFKNISTGNADAGDRILYKQSTGELFYDADGSGSGAAVKFAVLDNKAALTHADVLVV
jgi:Ca2+-binding RTX toxin-like protein